MDRSTVSEQEAITAFLATPTTETYSALFRVMAPRVLGYFRVRGCEPALAEDLTQEVMLAVYRQSRQLNNSESFRPWLFKIARNALLQDRRKRTRQPQAVDLEDVALPESDPLASLQFAQWMKALDAEERELIRLRYVEGLEYHQIAELLRMPLGTVQWKVFQSKKKLAARFGAAAGTT
jgi:RNA polymerase sigma-70 factor (ECF subfamily)